MQALRRGVVLTGERSASPASDFRRLPDALEDCAAAASGGVRRVLQKLT